jgi:hypothetical protein
MGENDYHEQVEKLHPAGGPGMAKKPNTAQNRTRSTRVRATKKKATKKRAAKKRVTKRTKAQKKPKSMAGECGSGGFSGSVSCFL